MENKLISTKILEAFKSKVLQENVMTDESIDSIVKMISSDDLTLSERIDKYLQLVGDSVENK